MSGDVSLEIWAAVEDFDPSGFGVVRASLVMCPELYGSCQELGTGDALFLQADHADFVRVIVNLGTIDVVVPTGWHLVVAIAAPDLSSHDLWVSFGSDTHPARLWVT